MPIANPDLVKFASRALSDVTEDGSIGRIEILHTSTEGNERIDTVAVEEGGDASELAQLLYDRAHADAQSRPGSGGPERYAMLAFRGEATMHEYQAACLISNETTLTFGDTTEPATQKGLLGQFMRHLENREKVTMASFSALLGRMSQELDRAQRELGEAQRVAMKSFELQQQLLDRESERRISEAKALSRAKRSDELMGIATGLAPLLLAKAAGVPPTATAKGGSPRDQSIRRLIGELREEQIETIVKTLEPDQLVAFLEVYQTFKEEQITEDAGKPALLRSVNGESNGCKEE